MSLRSMAAKPVNKMLRPMRVQLVPGRWTDPAVESFISARKTTAAAQKAGLSVSAYIDHTFAKPGTTEAAVDAMLELAKLPKYEVVCEIGPGTGRYAEKVIAAVRPGTYEIYETAHDWLPHLRRLPNAAIRDCDGRTLSQTTDASVDLVHAQKIFVYLQFYVVAGYLAEMARVVRPGGAIAFDIVTEDCLDDETVAEWSRVGTLFRPISRSWTIDYLGKRGLTLTGSHITALPVGTSELMVFHREA
jgi:ubiquinone/menaquinone biosynthesis C-methylase UbiE